MLLTALTPPLFPQGEARAAAEAKAQPLAPRQVLPPPARSIEDDHAEEQEGGKGIILISYMIYDIIYDIKYDM
jgi:hypothetical protein